MLEFIRGLVRPLISISLCATVVYLGIIGKLGADKVFEIFGVIVAFHFNERAINKVIDKLSPNGGTNETPTS